MPDIHAELRAKFERISLEATEGIALLDALPGEEPIPEPVPVKRLRPAHLWFVICNPAGDAGEYLKAVRSGLAAAKSNGFAGVLVKIAWGAAERDSSLADVILEDCRSLELGCVFEVAYKSFQMGGPGLIAPGGVETVKHYEKGWHAKVWEPDVRQRWLDFLAVFCLAVDPHPACWGVQTCESSPTGVNTLLKSHGATLANLRDVLDATYHVLHKTCKQATGFANVNDFGGTDQYARDVLILGLGYQLGFSQTDAKTTDAMKAWPSLGLVGKRPYLAVASPDALRTHGSAEKLMLWTLDRGVTQVVWYTVLGGSNDAIKLPAILNVIREHPLS